MRANKRVYYLFLLLAGLVLILTPFSALAQAEKPSLTLRLIPGDYYNDLVLGQDNTFSLLVSNTGNKTLTNIKLSSYAPKAWVVQFTPDIIDSINVSSSRTVSINIKPPESVDKRDYTVTVLAEAAEARTDTDFWFRIENGISVWLWIGIAVAVVVIAGFVILFLRFGRQ